MLPKRRKNMKEVAVPTKEDGDSIITKKQKKKESYGTYIYKILQQVHPHMEISSKTMVILNNYMDDMFNRLVTEARQLMIYEKQTTLTVRQIHTAVKLVLPGDLGKHAINEGTKAIITYNSNKSSGNEKFDEKKII